MSISLEALAMSGVDFLEVGFDIEEWEQMDLQVPPYLLANEEERRAKENMDQECSTMSKLCDINLKSEQYCDDEIQSGNHQKSWDLSKIFSRSLKRNFFARMSLGITFLWSMVWLLVQKCTKNRSFCT